MQDPNADTEWNDVLRAKGILPPKEVEISEDDVVKMVEETVAKRAQGGGKQLAEMSLDELNDNEDEIDDDDERAFELYRQQRLAQIKEVQARSLFGDVREISRTDYVTEVNKAGKGIWVVLHVYRNSIPLCKVINEYIAALATQFPEVKFLKSVADVCIPNYPDKNVPSIFIYFEDQLKKQFVGPEIFGGLRLKKDELEWMLSEVGVLKTDLEADPRKRVRDVMDAAVSDDNDW